MSEVNDAISNVAPDSGENNLTNADQSKESPWYNAAEDEVKGYIQNKGWKDPLEVVNAYKQYESFRGVPQDRIMEFPEDPAKEGALDHIYDKLGRPESADKYNVDIPDGININQDRLEMYREVAHKAGISDKQFQALAAAEFEQARALHQQQEQSYKQQDIEYQELMKEWGNNAQEREELSRRGFRSILPDNVDANEFASKIEDAIGTANTLKLFANVGEKMAREHKINDAGVDKPFGYTREQALADRQSLMAQLKDPEKLKAYNESTEQNPSTEYLQMKKLNKIIANQ